MSPLNQSMVRPEPFQADNASLLFETASVASSAQVPPAMSVTFHEAYEFLDLQQIEHRLYGLAASPGLTLEEILPVYTAGTVALSFGACRVVESLTAEHLFHFPVETPLAKLESEPLYAWRSPMRVRRFLQDHPRLVNVLIEACSHVTRHFGADSQVALQQFPF